MIFLKKWQFSGCMRFPAPTLLTLIVSLSKRYFLNNHLQKLKYIKFDICYKNNVYFCTIRK